MRNRSKSQLDLRGDIATRPGESSRVMKATMEKLNAKSYSELKFDNKSNVIGKVSASRQMVKNIN